MTFNTNLSTHRYPAIARAALEMSYDNGGINRDRSEADVLEALERIIADGGDIAFDLSAIDKWLGTLDENQMQVAVAGEQSEMERLLATAPTGTDAFLNSVFDHAS